MDISISEFENKEYTVYNRDFLEQVESLTVPPDEALFLDENLQGTVLSYQDVLKLLQESKITGRLMVFLINYLQSRSNNVSRFHIARSKEKEVELLNDAIQIQIKQKKGDPNSHILVLYFTDRWVCASYFIKTQILEIVDLQRPKTKDTLKKLFDSMLKLIGKYVIKTVTYVQQDEKSTDGGILILQYLYITYYKNLPFNKQSPSEKELFRQRLLWLIFKSERSRQIKYPPLPPLTAFNEQELKNFKPTDPVLNDSLTGFEVSLEDYEVLQKQGKSSPSMMAFWLSYLYSFDIDRKPPMLPFFVVANGAVSQEDFEIEFKLRRAKSAMHIRLIVVSLYKGRWVFAVYNMNEKLLHIVDLQNKGVTKDELQGLFDKIIEGLGIDYNNPKATFVLQTYTDSSDGTEYVVNCLWQYLNGTPLEKIKFGFSEKRQLRNRLLWALGRMFGQQVKSQSSLRSIKKVTTHDLSPQLDTIRASKIQIQQSPLLTQQDIPSQTQIKKAESPGYKNSPVLRDPEPRKSNFSKRKHSDYSPSSEQSDTSIKVKAGRFGQRAATKAVPLDKPRNQTQKVVQQETILETQRSEEYEDEDYARLFKKRQQQSSEPVDDVEGTDRLDRIQRELEEFYHDLLNEPEQEVNEYRLQEIFRIKGQIQKVIERRKMRPIKEVMDSLIMKPNQSTMYNSSLQNYSTIIHDDKSVMRILNEMLEHEDMDDSEEKSILKKRNYIVAELNQVDVSQPSFHAYDFPQQRNTSSLPSLKVQTKSELFQRTNLAAQRYGYKLEVPTMQQFYKDNRMPPQLLNFLLYFLQEKNQHKRSSNSNNYNTSIKIFPISFYLSLCNNLIHSTFRINYYEANSHTFEYSGQGQTIFEEFDWLIIPVQELPNEYSLVAVNLKRRACYCYLLSSLACKTEYDQQSARAGPSVHKP